MRAELAAYLLHDPEVLFLDEPTVGLDVVAKDRIRKFLRELNREKQTTILLTSHDMTDIDEICSRAILIDRGKKMLDESLEDFYCIGRKVCGKEKAGLDEMVRSLYENSFRGWT